MANPISGTYCNFIFFNRENLFRYTFLGYIISASHADYINNLFPAKRSRLSVSSYRQDVKVSFHLSKCPNNPVKSSDDWTVSDAILCTYPISLKAYVNTLRPRRNRRHFADDIFKFIFLHEMHEFWLKFHWSVFLRVQFTIFQHWFR